MNDTLENGTDSSSIPSLSSEEASGLALQTAVHSINLILGLPINGYVIWLILSGAGGTIASEFFYLNLIASVIVSSLASALHAWLFTHDFAFQMVSYFTFVAFFAFSVPSFQCCICVERYVAVLHPLVFRRHGRRLRCRAACCGVVWPTVLALSSFVFWSHAVACYVFLGFCAACVSVVSFCCLSVLGALKRPGPGEGQKSDGGEGQDAKRRAFRIILVSLVLMSATIMSYVPNIVSQLLDSSVPAAMYVTYAVALLMAFVHPLLYLHKAGKLTFLQIKSKSPVLSETRI